MLQLSNEGQTLVGCDKSAIGQIIVPEGVTTIAARAFQDCDSIIEIILPSSVSFLGGAAFSGCISLEKINIPERTTKISRECFKNCINLQEILLHKGITEVASEAFYNCINLKTINLPQTITYLYEKAFYGCENLQSIQIPERLSHIYSDTFGGCLSLTEIVIPERVSSIGDKAFSDCYSLRCLIIKSEHIDITPTAFLNCKELSRLYLADFNPNLAISSFGDCDKLSIISPLSDVSIIKSKQTISAREVYKKQSLELKYMSLFYRLFKMNLTQMKWSESLKNKKSFKEPIDSSWEELKYKEQPLSKILSWNWQNSAGIGLVLGFNNYRALDFDIAGDFVFKVVYNGGTVDDFIVEVLEALQLPNNYPWVVRSGNGYGFHVIFKCDDIDTTKEIDSISFEPNDEYWYDNIQYFTRVELRWSDHLVLPPSIHASGNLYFFRNRELPTISPVNLDLAIIDKLLYKYCGDRSFFTATYKERTFELTKVNKIRSRHDSYLSPHEVNVDSINYLKEISSPEGNNLLALQYLFGEDVDADIEKAIQIFEQEAASQSSLFNLLSLYSVGIKECTRKKYTELYNKLDKKLFNKHLHLLDENAKKYMPKSELYLFFDTETTGLPKDYNTPSSNIDNWPRLVQLSWIVTDQLQNIISQHNHIIKPENFIIPTESTATHGITTKDANEMGENLIDVLNEFCKDVKLSKFIIGHNIQFDKNVVEAEIIRMGIKELGIFHNGKTESLCTMKGTIDFCQLRNNYGYRYPKLQELYTKLFGKPFDGAHNAFSDIIATMTCFWELKKRGWSNEDFIQRDVIF